MAIPQHVKHVVIGAGVHGLSTAYHLALALKARGRGDGRNILVIDKAGITAGASGIACGVVRNNYYQPASRTLPLRALRRGQAASGFQQPVPVELGTPWRANDNNA